jgi:hypothetical protein
MTGPPAAPLTLPLFRRGDWYTSLDAAPLTASAQVGMSLAPEILFRDDARDARRVLSAPGTAPSDDDRRRILRRAMDLFVEGGLDVPPFGIQDPASFEQVLLEFAGLPPALVRRWCQLLRGRIEELLAVDARGQYGSLALVSLPSNTFTCLESCAAAVLSAGALWVRPSVREPFTALRFVAALLAAGWPADRLGLYGTSRAALPALVNAVDRATLYGGAELERRFGDLGHVTVCGPGRAVAVVDPQLTVTAAVAWLKPLVAADGGRFCTNVGTVLCRQGAKDIGGALAEELDAIPPGSLDWPLAFATDSDAAGAIARRLHTALRPGDRRLTRRSIDSVDRGRPFLAALANIRSDESPRYTAGARFIHRYGDA